MISSQLQQVLVESGWSPGRSIDIERWVHELTSHGLTMLPQARLILQNFGGLTISPVRTPADAYSPEVIIFDPLHDTEYDRIEYWQDCTGMKLTPLGASPKGTCLMLAENGQIFGGWDRFLFKYGNSFDEAMENSLIFAKSKPTEHCG